MARGKVGLDFFPRGGGACGFIGGCWWQALWLGRVLAGGPRLCEPQDSKVRGLGRGAWGWTGPSTLHSKEHGWKEAGLRTPRAPGV